MNKCFIVIAFLTLFLLISNSVAGSYPDYSASWQAIDTLIAHELTQSALDSTDHIYAKAKSKGNAAQMIKALMYHMRLMSFKEEEVVNKVLERMNQELVKARFPVAPLLHSMLGECYSRYYMNNGSQQINRAQPLNFNMKDIRTWDNKTLLDKATSEYKLSLTDKASLKKTPIRVFNEVITDSMCISNIRPTLYDFLTRRAVEFYAFAESYHYKPVTRFSMDNPDYFKPYDLFIKTPIITPDSTSFKFRALTCLQEVMAFHANDSDPEALIDADLERLGFVLRNTGIVGKESLYLKALENLMERSAKSPASAEVAYRIAQHYIDHSADHTYKQDSSARWMNKKAMAICEKAIKAFPGSYGGRRCASLAAQISIKKLIIETEGVNLPDRPFKILTNYKNVSGLFWRIIRMDGKQYQDMAVSQSYNDSSIMVKLTALKPLTKGVMQLPNPGDFQEHSVEIAMPALPIGRYIILAAIDSGFIVNRNTLAYAMFQISRIGLIMRMHSDGGTEFRFLDRETGDPLKNGNLTSSGWPNQTENLKANQTTLLTDREGCVVVPYSLCENDRTEKMEFILNSDSLFLSGSYCNHSGSPDTTMKSRTFFFTDRTLYRPGQTIFFKGIRLLSNGNRSEIAGNASCVVKFMNTNYEEVSSLSLTTNKYGSFHGSFIAPTNGLNGWMSIRDEFGGCSFSVEEYKRPGFEVKLEPLPGTIRLGDEVRLQGKVVAFTGSVVDAAKIKYQVIRKTYFENYYSRRKGYWRNSPITEIASGTTSTNDTGGFVITFKALPDPEILKEEQPKFDFIVLVDVTDVTGETRSAQKTFGVGYASLGLNIALPQLMNKESRLIYQINTTNLDSTFTPAKGNVIIHALCAPRKVYRKRLWDMPDTTILTKSLHDSLFPLDMFYHEMDTAQWLKNKKVFSSNFDTEKGKLLNLDIMKRLPAGEYLLEAEINDPFGEKVKYSRFFTLFSEKDDTLPFPQPDWFVPIKTTSEPGDSAVFLVGSGYENVRILYEVEHKSRIISQQWINVNKGQKRVVLPILEKYRGGVGALFTFIRNNRTYSHEEKIIVPWTNKELKISLETFRSKLLPGEKEEWRLKITGKNKDKLAAEMVITLYDASLDALSRPNHWDFDVNYHQYRLERSWEVWRDMGLSWKRILQTADWNVINDRPLSCVPALNWFGAQPDRIMSRFMNMSGYGSGYGGSGLQAVISGKSRSSTSLKKSSGSDVESFSILGSADQSNSLTENPSSPDVNLSQVYARRNLNECAFFYPDLATDEKGEIIVRFQAPEALTRWRMLGLAHTKDLQTGQITDSLVTQKDIMVMPNPPRFLRENDLISFTAKVSNLSDKELSGSAQLMLYDAATMTSVDSAFKNNSPQMSFAAKKGQSAALCWKLSIPTGYGAVLFKVVAVSGDKSDGEERLLPVLSNRIMVTETMPISMNGKGLRKFTFDKLISKNKGSTTLSNHRLTLEWTSNPVWTIIQALPFMMEAPYECAEQLFSRFYANSMASFIVNANLQIKRVFEIWQNQQPEALISSLEKNSELKTIALDETPWLMDGKDESERKRRIALLFDLNRMASEKESALGKLLKLQSRNGGWPWFEGMPEDRFITQYIAIGMGRLDHLKILDIRTQKKLWNCIKGCLQLMDERVHRDYEELQRDKHPDLDHLGEIHAQYLYARSYFKDMPVDSSKQKAFDYFMDQAKRFWPGKGRAIQGMIAIALHRYGEKDVPEQIIRALRENSLHSEEMGIYWKEWYENNGFWHRAPIESQSLLIEAFDEVAHDSVFVEGLKTWLLKSKQTQNWPSTKATAEACYALLLKGQDGLLRTSDAVISIGGSTISTTGTNKVLAEAGTGYFKTSWSGPEIKPDMGNITVTQNTPGISWGGVVWQYFEQMDKVSKSKTPLSMVKNLFLQVNSPEGPKLKLITDKVLLKPGDKITVRIELRTDRELEYVHMKDMRASGLEPLNVLSGYRWQDGLDYYESTRDAATHFFFSRVKKGTSVFEYQLIVSHAGYFSNGITEIQCLYAPEFTSHSEGVRIKVE